MNLLNILNPFIQKETPLIEARMKVLRFRKFLENARVLIDLIHDAQEKINGEYILDRSYIASLVDKVIENARMFVFNACILIPEGGDVLYKQYDEHKFSAQNDFLNLLTKKSMTLDKNETEEPEYQLLRNVIAWMTGPLSKSIPTVMDFIKQTFDHVVYGLNKFVYPQGIVNQFDLSNSYHLDLLQLEEDNILSKEKETVIKDIQCRPLGLLLMGHDKKLVNTGISSSANQKNWFAAISKDYISLSTKNPKNIILIDAQLSGFIDSDYIFIFADNSINLTQLLPDGFQAEKTKLGTMAWNYDVPENILENNLIHLGQKLFKVI